jgi:murein L,D-transpeptidase YafK
VRAFLPAAALLFMLPLPARAEEKSPRFEPTRAQQDYSRVRDARANRTEDLRALFREKDLDYPPAQVLLRIFKQDDVVELWVQPAAKQPFVHLKDYAVCARSGTLGPKRRMGDLQVPEGFYQVSTYNPTSLFHLSMKVSYPNASDKIRGAKGSLGGDIFIHGSCVTIGCVPLTDRWIEELYLIALDTATARKNPTLVHLFPTRMTDESLAALKRDNPRPEWHTLWDELKVGYDRFEKDHLPARFTVDQDGAYQLAAP